MRKGNTTGDSEEVLVRCWWCECFSVRVFHWSCACDWNTLMFGTLPEWIHDVLPRAWKSISWSVEKLKREFWRSIEPIVAASKDFNAPSDIGRWFVSNVRKMQFKLCKSSQLLRFTWLVWMGTPIFISGWMKAFSLYWYLLCMRYDRQVQATEEVFDLGFIEWNVQSLSLYENRRPNGSKLQLPRVSAEKWRNNDLWMSAEVKQRKEWPWPVCVLNPCGLYFYNKSFKSWRFWQTCSYTYQ